MNLSTKGVMLGWETSYKKENLVGAMLLTVTRASGSAFIVNLFHLLLCIC
jgi:hypothetical protein